MRSITTDHFKKQLKHLRKHRTLSADVTKALQTFSKDNAQYLGAKLYKVRVRSSDGAKGKSGGFRLIVFCIEVTNHLIPITIYRKSVQESITEHELEYHLACVRAELEL